MLDPKLEEAPPAPAHGVFEGGKGSCCARPVGSVISAMEPVTLLLACSGFYFFHKHDLHCSAGTLDTMPLEEVALMR